MNQPRRSQFINTIFVIAVAIAATGAVKYVSYRNMQTQTRREIQKIENRILAIHQDEIPSYQAEIDQHLIRYDIREKLRAAGSDLVPTPPERIQVIRPAGSSPHGSTP